MKNRILGLCLFVILLSPAAQATEGMWLPLLLQSLNEAEMQSMGMKMTAEDIYSVNKGSLKDAIVHFGGGCTSELISNSGLLLTNHHCGYGQIQSHSTMDKNYLKDGFWAKGLEDELPNEGLFATFIDRIEDVTKMAFKGVKSKMTPSEKQSVIDKNINKIKEAYTLSAFQKVMVKPFFKGNQYFLFLTTQYNDVRLVGAPPESIGKFGSDTDNWVWPRHTGDFSMFRIYANKDNGPADYSKDNIPYTPKHFLPIAMDGVEKDDFTLVFGFPGRTNQYLPAVAVEQLVNTLNPARIEIREEALAVLDKNMKKDPEIRLKYASKFARIANYWKKWIGESQGLEKSKGIDKKLALEKEFTEKVDSKRKYRKKYGHILSEFKKGYDSIKGLEHAKAYYDEVTRRNVELLGMTHYVYNLASKYDANDTKAFEDYKARVVPYIAGKYKDFNANVDQEVAMKLIGLMKEKVNPALLSSSLKESNTKDIVSQLYGSSMTSVEDFMQLMEGDAATVMAQLKKDPAFIIYSNVRSFYDTSVAKPYSAIKLNIDDLQKDYMAGLIELFPNKRFWPDANSTLRVSYGQVQGYDPMDAVTYKPVSYLDGVIEKYVPGDYEFDVPAKLLDLYETRDYGQYADSNGKMPVCFLGTNHTTGGNSGSPAIDAHGNLVGLNFDRVWEGTMSDINYDKRICRNIMVDIRYVLFIVDKYAGATRLIDEMKLVHPKIKR